MVEYLRPVRPNAAPVKMLDPYYRPLLDNRESQALEKLASAIGNLRGPINNLAEVGMQAKRNQLQMMKMQQNLELQEQENAFKLYKAEQGFALQQARDAYQDFNDSVNDISRSMVQQAELDQLAFEAGMSVPGFNIAETGGVPQDMYSNVQYDRDVVTAADEAARVVGLDLELNEPDEQQPYFSGPTRQELGFTTSRTQPDGTKMSASVRLMNWGAIGRITNDGGRSKELFPGASSNLPVPGGSLPTPAFDDAATGVRYFGYWMAHRNAKPTINSIIDKYKTQNSEGYKAHLEAASGADRGAELTDEQLAKVFIGIAQWEAGSSGAPIATSILQTMPITNLIKQGQAMYNGETAGAIPVQYDGATFQLRDPVTGSIVPADGTDKRASSFITMIKETGGGAVAVGPGHISGATLRLTRGEQSETGESWIDQATAQPVNDVVIQDYSASSAVQSMRRLQAQRNAQIRADGQQRGMSAAQIEAAVQRASADDQFYLQRAFLTEQKAARGVRLQNIQDDMSVKAKEIAKRLKDVSIDSEIPMDDDVAYAQIYDEMYAHGIAEGHSPEEVQAALSSKFVMDQPAWTAYVDRVSEISANEELASRNYRMVSNLVSELDKGRNVLDAFQIATNQNGVDANMAATFLINQTEILGQQASAASASQLTTEQYYKQVSLIDQLLGSGAFNGIDESVRERAVTLVKVGDDAVISNRIRQATNDAKLLGGNPQEIFKVAKAMERDLAPAQAMMTESERGQLITAQQSFVSLANEAEDVRRSDPNVPVSDDMVVYEFRNGEVQQRTQVNMEAAQDAAGKQATAIRNTWIPAIRAQDVGSMRQAYETASKNGYADGIMQAVAAQVIGDEEFVDTDTIGAINTLVDLSNEIGNPYVDFAGDQGMQIIAMMPGKFSENYRAFGRAVVQQDLITADHVQQVADAIGYVGANDSTAEALMLIGRELPRLQVNGNDASVIQKQIDKLANRAEPNRLFRFQGEGGVLSSFPIPGMESGAQVNVYGSKTNRDLIQSRYRLNAPEMQAVTALATELGLRVANQANVQLLNDDQKLSKLEFTLNADGVSMHRADKDIILFETDGQMAILGDRKTAPTGPVPLSPVTFGREYDTSVQGQTTHLLLDGLGGQTYDILNARGSMTVRATFDDGTSEDFPVTPDQFIAVPTAKYNLGPDHGNFAYMLPNADKYSGASSIELIMDGAIQYSAPQSADLNSVFFHWATLVQAYKIDQRDYKLTLLGGK